MAKPSESQGGKIRFAEFELDLRRGELRKRGIRIRVQEQPLKILTALLEQPGEVVTREELRKRVWGEETFVEFEHGLNAAVNRLREALCDSAEQPRYVETVARRGYRFIAVVEVAGQPEVEAPKPPEPPKRSPWTIWAAAALALAVASGLGIWSLTRNARQEPMRVVPLTTDLGNELMPSFSPDGKQVVYTWTGEKDDNHDIYVKVVGSAGHPLRLTSSPAQDLNPVWSPDGSQIAFVRRMGGQASVYLISPLGGGERRLGGLADSKAPGLAWAPNGKVLAVAEVLPQAANGIFALDIGTGQKWRLTSNPSFLDQSPAFSPDGRFLAYAASAGMATGEVFLLPLGTDSRPQGQPRQITHQGYVVRGITWAADGQSLVYSASREAGVNPYLWRVPLSGKNDPERLEVAGANALSPAVSPGGNRMAFARGVGDTNIVMWKDGEVAGSFISSTRAENQARFSPDGSRIAFSSDRSGGGHQIWTCNRDGSNQVQLTGDNGRFRGSPYWSPDGRHLVFDSQGEDGHWDLYRIEASGGQAQRLTASASDDSAASYSRDGRRIYYGSNRSGRLEIWRMPASGGEAIQVTRGGGYFAIESWDGKTLYYNNAAGNANEISPLMALSLTDGRERRVVDAMYARCFVPMENGIYYVGPAMADGKFPLSFHDFATGRSRILTRFEGPPGMGLTVSPDKKAFLFTVRNPGGVDLMLIDNFK